MSENKIGVNVSSRVVGDSATTRHIERLVEKQLSTRHIERAMTGNDQTPAPTTGSNTPAQSSEKK